VGCDRVVALLWPPYTLWIWHADREAVFVSEWHFAVETAAYSAVVGHAVNHVLFVIDDHLHRPLIEPVTRTLHVRHCAIVADEA